MSANEPSQAPGPVLLFDSECGLCNRLVGALLRLDDAGRLRYAPLQSLAARQFLRLHSLPETVSTVVLVPDWSRPERIDYAVRSAAILAALQVCGCRRLAFLLGLWPVGLRDAVYRLVARWRRKVFGAGRPDLLLRRVMADRFLN